MIALVVIAWFHGMPVARTVAHFEFMAACERSVAWRLPRLKSVAGIKAELSCRRAATRLVGLF